MRSTLLLTRASSGGAASISNSWEYKLEEATRTTPRSHRALLREGSLAQVAHRLLDLFPRVHDERTVARDRFVQRFAGD
jgi:hypothetical protein